MSSRVDTTKLFQQSMLYDKHRLKLNRIKTKSSPVFKKKQEQDSILDNRHYHQNYNTKFKHRENEQQIQRKNSLIISKMLSLSKIQRPGSNRQFQIRDRMENSRTCFKRQTMRSIDLANDKFVKKLTSVKSTISRKSLSSSFYDHKRRSQMLSKFKVNSASGSKIPKNMTPVEKRIKLEPIHQKLKIIEAKERAGHNKPITFNSAKLERMNVYNPEGKLSANLTKRSRQKMRKSMLYQ